MLGLWFRVSVLRFGDVNECGADLGDTDIIMGFWFEGSVRSSVILDKDS